MPEEQILIQIKNAEKKAAELILKAQSEREKMIAEAQKKAMEKISKSEEKMRLDADIELKKFYASLNAKKENILAKGKKDAEAMKSKAAKNVPKASDFLFDCFRKQAGA